MADRSRLLSARHEYFQTLKWHSQLLSLIEKTVEASPSDPEKLYSELYLDLTRCVDDEKRCRGTIMDLETLFGFG